jgi:hypothetical protein
MCGEFDWSLYGSQLWWYVCSASTADTADTADTAANTAARDKALLVPGRKMRGECNRFLHDSQLRRQV